jgi:Leucine-rich repeat (LRR) protein
LFVHSLKSLSKSANADLIFKIVPSKYLIDTPTILIENSSVSARLLELTRALTGLPCIFSCYCLARHLLQPPSSNSSNTSASSGGSSSSSGSMSAIQHEIYGNEDARSPIVSASQSLADRILSQPQMFNVLTDDNDSLQQSTVSRADAEANMRQYAIQVESDCLREHNAQLATLGPSVWSAGAVRRKELQLLQALPFTVLQQMANEKVQVLDLARCRLKTLPVEIPLLANLTKLVIDSQPGYLRGNQLTSLPESIGLLVNLTHLSVANNRLVTLPASIGQLEQLTTLWANNNNLIQLPSQISQLRKLERLVVCDNLLRSLPSEMHVLRHVSTFVIANNPLLYPPNAHNMHVRDLFEYMRLHPNEEESVIKAE